MEYQYTVVNTIAIIVALVIIIIVAIIKNEDVKNKRRYQEIILFVYIFGVFIILISGVEWLCDAEKIGTMLPMLIASIIMTGVVMIMYMIMNKKI